MSCVLCPDEPWVSSRILYAERTKIVTARRMETDGRYDDLYEAAIDALDRLLDQTMKEIDNDEWKRGVQHVQAQLLAAMLGDCHRCDFFRGVYRGLVEAGLIVVDQ
ncbi:hypothetical protein SAMN05421548_11916 [Paraburkholderia lycopersici]|uniref:Uncharacterized protein n=1 Tax=Paraburkholderia lycopersici TaxID=416944 RepID=A0A1G6UHV3_9BURK|nr:hypothetical protein SAMN05421548_11916 [Paraburkholderia lycopersici]